MITNMLAALRWRIEARRRYVRAMREIEALNIRDLVDLGADRAELEAGVYREIYGRA